MSGAHVKEVNVYEKGDSTDDTTARGADAPQHDVEFPFLFVSLESAAEAGDNGDAVLYPQKATMAFMRAHAS